MPSKADLDDFAGFCRNATDAQLRAIEDKERSAGRRAYANVAKEEAARRNGRVPYVEVDRETAYGTTTRLSRSIRVF